MVEAIALSMSSNEAAPGGHRVPVVPEPSRAWPDHQLNWRDCDAFGSSFRVAPHASHVNRGQSAQGDRSESLVSDGTDATVGSHVLRSETCLPHRPGFQICVRPVSRWMRGSRM